MTSLLFDKEGGGALTPRILHHVDRYRMTTPHAVERLFFANEGRADRKASLQQAQAALNELVEEGRITRLAKPKRKKKSPTATESEGSATSTWSFEQSVYVSPGHKVKPGEDLARLWYCCLGEERRFYAEYREVMGLFAADGINEKEGPHQNCFHVFAEEEGGAVLYRLYLCRAVRKNAAQQIKKFLAQRNSKHYQHWIEQGCYGLAILVESEQKKKEIEGLLQESYGGAPKLDDRARFTVSVIPTEDNYEQAIKKYEQEAWT